MSIFISHSSHDGTLAEDLAHRLQRQGHPSLFLDFDPEHGIVAGQSWERCSGLLRAGRGVTLYNRAPRPWRPRPDHGPRRVGERQVLARARWSAPQAATNAHTAFAYWIRRSIDGTAEELFGILAAIVDAYDPELIALMADRDPSLIRSQREER